MSKIMRDFEKGTLCKLDGSLVTSRKEAVSMDADGPMKGVAGEGTGSAARAAIRAAVEKGLTHEEIGNLTNRSASVIGAILSGEIANPPSDVATRIRKGI